MSATETIAVGQMETVHMKLQPKPSEPMIPQPPHGPKPRAKLRLDPQRALEPARKKLSTLEAQRVMSALADTIKKTELVISLPYVLANLDRFRVTLGAELVQLLEDHHVVIESFKELKGDAERFLERDQRAAEAQRQKEEEEADECDDLQERDASSRPASAASISSQTDAAMRNLSLVAKQMQTSCKNIMRSFASNPTAINAIAKDEEQRSDDCDELIGQMNEMKDILMNMLLTTPVEQSERNQYLKELSEREKYNAGVIVKLERELQAADEDRDNEIRKKNDIIRELQANLHHIEKFSDDHIKRTRTEAEKQEAADLKNSEGKKQKLQQDTAQLKTQLQNLVQEHRESEQVLRRKKFQVETEVENWIQKYDQDMGERQDEYEEIDAVYTEEKKQLNELEERFRTLEAEYNQIQEERRVARERREAAERELQVSVKAATTIQAFWRSFKVRKALKSKKKKKGGKKKK